MTLVQAGSEIWLGGVFSVDGSDKWVWDTLIDPKTKESTALSDFALSLFQGGVPPQPSKKSVTSYTFIDKYTGQLDSTEPTSDLRFICEVSQLSFTLFMNSQLYIFLI